MLIERPLHNLRDSLVDESEIDWLDLTWIQCGRRALQKQTRGDREVRLLLRIGITLRHGDLLAREEGVSIVVNVLPCELLVASPKNSQELISVAFKLGDLHVPIQLIDDQILTPADGPSEAALHELGVAFEIQHRRFEPSLRSAAQITFSDNLELNRIR